MVGTVACPHEADMVIMSGNTDGNSTKDIPFDTKFRELCEHV